MTSIRRQLLCWLLCGMALSSIATAAFLYFHIRAETDELYDAHLHHIAVMLAHQLSTVDEAKLNPQPLPAYAQKAWEEEVYLIQIWDPSGRLRDAMVPTPETALAVPLLTLRGLNSIHLNGRAWRVYRADGEKVIVQIAQPQSARDEMITETTLNLLLPLLLQIPLVVLLAWFAVRRGLRPLDQLTSAIAQRQPDALTPVPLETLPSDVQPLGVTLNDLLARLEAALQQQRNFIADAAHELRTPVAALQLQLDLLQRAATEEDRARALQALNLGVHRATHLISQLLRIARSGATQATTTPIAVALQEVGVRLLERHLPSARARGIDLGVTRLEPVSLYCIPGDIETILDNLLTNALRYTPRGGKIDLAIYSEARQLHIDVIDTGIGIPEAERERIFDRFHRVLTLNDSAETEGAGLGLAIVKTLCTRYGATIAVTAGPDGSGSHFKIRWPL